MAIDVRTLLPDELAPAWQVFHRAFGAAVPTPEESAADLALVDPARFYAGHADDRLVATAGSFDLTMGVPGHVVPVAGVSWVSVLPTYRRRGVLTTLMGRLLEDLHEAGTAVAALWATEGAIYGRYGYGPAAWNAAVVLPRGAAFRGAARPGEVRLVDPDAALLAPTYDHLAAVTPGLPGRDQRWWDYRLADVPSSRHGSSELQCVVADGGYALYAVEDRSDDGVPAGVVHVREVLALDEGSRRALWRHLLDLDLSAEVRTRALAVDDPLLLTHLAEPRRARASLRDGLWVRVVDLPEALRSRRYACEVDVVLEVDDPRAPWNTGRWRVTGDRSGAACVRTRAPADLVLGPEDLGATYLGGTPLRSRDVEERSPGALDVASTAFGPLGRAPWCPLVF